MSGLVVNNHVIGYALLTCKFTHKMIIFKFYYRDVGCVFVCLRFYSLFNVIGHCNLTWSQTQQTG